MITPSDLIKYISIENALTTDELGYDDLLSITALEERGIALTNLKLVDETENNSIKTGQFSVKRNFSKLKPGDKVIVSSDKISIDATILESEVYSVTLALGKKTKIDKEKLWTIKLKSFFYNESIVDSLNKLRKGYPGWIHFDQMFNGGFNSAFRENKQGYDLAADDYKKLENFNLDISQLDCIKAAIKLPPYLTIQGPPGTGKTLILAITADILTERCERIVILAPTHQAVNNALNSILEVNPQRKCIKIGDPIKNIGLNKSIEIMQFRFLDQFIRQGNSKDNLIVGMTFHSSIYNLVNRRTQFLPTVVMVDEAGQLASAYGSAVGMIGAGSILLYGDDKQMPPIFNSELKGHPISKSLFSLAKKSNIESLKRLEITYRMNRQICDIVSNSFYFDNDNDFITPSSDAAVQKLDFNLDNCKDSFIKVALNNENSVIWVSYQSVYSQQLNKIEVDITTKLLEYLLHNRYSSNLVAVVTPFRRQAAEIRRKMLEQFEPENLPIIDTVERVQGLTVDIIIISMCASDPDYIDNVSEFLLSENRINVAISRARKKVIIICSDELLNSKPKQISAYKTKQKLQNIKKACYELSFII